MRIVGNRGKRVADFVGDTGRDTPHRGQLFDAHAQLICRKQLFGHTIDAGCEHIELMRRSGRNALGRFAHRDRFRGGDTGREWIFDDALHFASHDRRPDDRNEGEQNEHDRPSCRRRHVLGQPHGRDDADQREETSCGEDEAQSRMDAGEGRIGHAGGCARGAREATGGREWGLGTRHSEFAKSYSPSPNAEGPGFRPAPHVPTPEMRLALLAARAARLAFGKTGRRCAADSDVAARTGRVRMRGTGRPARGGGGAHREENAR